MLYYQRKCETKITILLNFYGELNFISKFFQSFLQKIEIFWKIPVNIFYFQIFEEFPMFCLFL